MKIVLAPDSFKGSLTAAEAAEAMAEGIRKIIRDCEVCLLPAADGGEGTLRAVVCADNIRNAAVHGPAGNIVRAEYGINGKTGIIESAAAAGLMLAPEPRRTGMTSTEGVGELVRECLVRGCSRILLTLGGTATNDGGCGMLHALGAKFFREDGSRFVPVGLSLREISRIDISNLSEVFRSCSFTLACDVQNRLLGAEGATYVYAPQKGADADDLRIMEEGMAHYAGILRNMTGRDVSSMISSGAAGGLGVPVMAFGECEVKSGIEAVLNACDFEGQIKDADLVITGEGSIDRQSLYGKAISGVAAACVRKNIPLYAIGGRLECSPSELPQIRKILTVEALAENSEDAMRNAAKYVRALGSLAAIDALNGLTGEK